MRAPSALTSDAAERRVQSRGERVGREQRLRPRGPGHVWMFSGMACGQRTEDRVACKQWPVRFTRATTTLATSPPGFRVRSWRIRSLLGFRRRSPKPSVGHALGSCGRRLPCSSPNMVGVSRRLAGPGLGVGRLLARARGDRDLRSRARVGSRCGSTRVR